MKRKLTCLAIGICFAAIFAGMFTGTANVMQWPLPVQLFALFTAVVTALGAYADMQLNENKK
jgi:hypothetical protein